LFYAAVEGKDIEGVLRDGSFKHIFPQKWELSIKSYTNHSRALVQAAQLLLEQSYKGVLLQSQINGKVSQRKYIVRVRQNKTN
jgi:hypothetical protein